jgi:menaquinone-dependent protoporphyrinogen oxidase
VRRPIHLGVREHVIFGGRLPLEPEGFVERSMVEKCPPDKRDLRDWDAIRTWGRLIAAELPSMTQTT